MQRISGFELPFKVPASTSAPLDESSDRYNVLTASTFSYTIFSTVPLTKQLKMGPEVEISHAGDRNIPLTSCCCHQDTFNLLTLACCQAM